MAGSPVVLNRRSLLPLDPIRGGVVDASQTFRWTLIGLGAVVAIVLLWLVTLFLLQRPQAGAVAETVVVDGVEVGGMTEQELRTAVEQRADERGALPVEVIAADEHVEVDRDTVGVRYDSDAAVDEAWAYGRGWTWSTLMDQIEQRRGRWHHVDLPRDVEHQVLTRWAEDAAAELTREPRSASVEFVVTDDTVDLEVTDPLEGREVRGDDLADAVLDAFDEGTPETDGTLTIEAPVHDVAAPAVTEADLDTAVADARRAVSAPVVLVSPAPTEQAELVLDPPDLARMLTVETSEDAPEGERLRLSGDQRALLDLLGEEGFEPFRAEPTEATIELVDDEVVIEGGEPGFEPDPEETVELVLELVRAEGDGRQGELPGDLEEPDLSREEAEELGIEQEVSSFTTPLVPGQPRNTNLQLAADYLDGSVIFPGERFSLNAAIGERTEERGFVENGFIDEGGDLVSVRGGGVSQMGTTFMNAAWFAGVELLEFYPHSLYFERYPMGREATLAWGALDVVIHNDSPYGILVASEADEQEVEVAFWSSPWAQVETVTGEPYDREEGEVRDGFTVDFERTITYPDGSSTTETYTHTYEAQDEDDD